MSTDRNRELKFLNKAFLYQYYQNSKNGIEDPLFTGFTLDIDTDHSPLFYTNYETTTILRGDGDTELADEIERRLTTVNKVYFAGNPDTYELNTLSSKDPIADRKAGYGLQEKFYLDNVVYGATDYIYMVDKVTEGAFSDNIGVGDIGNGTPNASALKQYSEVLSTDPDTAMNAQSVNDEVNNVTSSVKKINIFFDLDQSYIRDDQKSAIETLAKIMNDNPNCTVHLSGYADKETGTADHNMVLSDARVVEVDEALQAKGIDTSRITTSYYGDTVQPFYKEMNRAVTCEIDGDVSQESALSLKIVNESSITRSIKDGDDKEQNSIINEHDKNKEDADKAKEPYEKLKTQYDETDKKIKQLEDYYSEQKTNARGEFNEYIETMTNAVKKLEALPEGEEKNKTAELITNTYNDFKNFVDCFNQNKASEKYPDISLKINEVRPEDLDKFKNEIEKLSADDKSHFIETYKKAWSVIKSTVPGIASVKDSSNETLTAMKKEREDLSKQLYGVHDDGSTGCEQNPAGGVYNTYKEAKDKLNNDTYSMQQRRISELNDIKDNYDNIKQYEAYQETKKNQIENNLPTIDYAMTDAEKDDPSAYANRLREQRDIRQTYEVPQTVYDMLGFIYGMHDLTYKYPYMLQTVTGLDDAYKKYFDLKDPYMGSGDGKITISCLEYLDMRISSMFNKYFNAVYDHQYKRERVPVNLKRFQCSIFVHDIRNFKDSIKGDVEQNGGDLSKIVQVALNSLSAIEFKFYDCEIVPEETGGIFDSVSNLPSSDMKTTNFTFTYGNCVINFLPFEDLRKYLLQKDIPDIKPNPNYYSLDERNNQKYQNNSLWKSANLPGDTNNPDGNFRRWFDKSPLGNVTNDDYRDYVRKDSTVAVDDHFKTTIVNNFAMNSVVQKNKELTEMDDALRRLVVGISASTGIPVKGVTDALNIKQIEPLLRDEDYLAAAVTKNLGNVYNSKVIDTNTTEYIGTSITDDEKTTSTKVVDDLGNVNDEKGGK